MGEVLESIKVNQERDDKKMEENTKNNGSNTLLCRGFFLFGFVFVQAHTWMHIHTYRKQRTA